MRKNKTKNINGSAHCSGFLVLHLPAGLGQEEYAAAILDGQAHLFACGEL